MILATADPNSAVNADLASSAPNPRPGDLRHVVPIVYYLTTRRWRFVASFDRSCLEPPGPSEVPKSYSLTVTGVGKDPSTNRRTLGPLKLALPEALAFPNLRCLLDQMSLLNEKHHMSSGNEERLLEVDEVCKELMEEFHQHWREYKPSLEAQPTLIDRLCADDALVIQKLAALQVVVVNLASQLEAHRTLLQSLLAAYERT